MKARNWVIFCAALLGAGLAWIWASRISPGYSTAGLIPAPRQGFAAPDFTLENQAGESVQLAGQLGKPVILNIWASWCTPCRAEMPALQQLYQDYQGKGLEILAVNSTSQDSRQAALDFAADLGLTFPILFDQQGKVSNLYQVQALPSTYFIDAQGVIREVVIGGPMSAALLRVRAERLLLEQQPLQEQP